VINDEKMDKLIQYFSMLPEDKQDHVLGILQALVFACDEICHEEADETRYA